MTFKINNPFNYYYFRMFKLSNPICYHLIVVHSFNGQNHITTHIKRMHLTNFSSSNESAVHNYLYCSAR